jgi:2-keto-4-pentenoate hydratase/2-oxohepta-3-ene-1,7-dioic acid hydratase in catechol pathway
MKIICIGRNYVEHAAELNNDVPTEPVVFMKADTAILKDGKPFYHPEFSNDIHHEIELVLKIGRNGRHIAPEFAHSYISEIGIGIDFTARDLQEKLKNKGLPWELSKAFDFSAVLGDFTPVDQFSDFKNISFGLKKNGEWQQKGNTSLMIFPFDTIISYVSQFFTLKIGDYIFTGTPAGVSKINIGDRLEGFLENASALSCEIR